MAFWAVGGTFWQVESLSAGLCWSKAVLMVGLKRHVVVGGLLAVVVWE
jgi:hypothetical protein